MLVPTFSFSILSYPHFTDPDDQERLDFAVNSEARKSGTFYCFYIYLYDSALNLFW